MLIQEFLQDVHLDYEKNTDYPDTGSEDFKVRLVFTNKGIKVWEDEVNEGVYWPVLKETASIAAAGLGSDSLPDDFLSFMRAKESPAVIKSGEKKWTESSINDGNRMKQENLSPNVFWIEAGKIATLPVITGTIEFPYLRKANRFSTGNETDPIDPDENFLHEFVLAQLYLDDKNFDAYQVHLQAAKEHLDKKKNQLIAEIPDDSAWGFGM